MEAVFVAVIPPWYFLHLIMYLSGECFHLPYDPTHCNYLLVVYSDMKFQHRQHYNQSTETFLAGLNMKRENSIVVWLPCKEMMCLTPSVVESCQGKSSKKSLTSWKSTHITQTSLPHQCLTLSDVFEPRLSFPLPRLQNWKSKSNGSTTYRFWCVQNKMDIDNDVNNVLLIPKFSARFFYVRDEIGIGNNRQYSL